MEPTFQKRRTQGTAPHARGRRQQKRFFNPIKFAGARRLASSSSTPHPSPPPSRNLQSALPPLLSPVFVPAWLPRRAPGPPTRPALPRALQWAAPPGGVSTRETLGPAAVRQRWLAFVCQGHSGPRGGGAASFRDSRSRRGHVKTDMTGRFACENVKIKIKQFGMQ